MAELPTIDFPGGMNYEPTPAYDDKIMLRKATGGDPVYTNVEDFVSAAGNNVIGSMTPSGSPSGTEANGQSYRVSNSTDTDETYTNFGGVVVPAMSSGFLIKSGGIWSYLDTPVDVDLSSKTDTGGSTLNTQEIDDKKLDVTEFNNYKPYIPKGMIFDWYDRPDLNWDSVIIDENNNILSVAGAGISDQVVNYDRPDIENAVVDKEMKIVSITYNKRPKAKPNIPYYIPTSVEGYATTSDQDLVDYETIIEKWEDIRQNIGAGYVTRTQIGTSSKTATPIWRYDFKPSNPLQKELFVIGTHGSEKVPIKVGVQFFKALCVDWYKDASLNYLRNNVHFVVIPILSPDGIIGFDGSTGNGGRRVPECNPFPVSWTKSGTEVTITYDAADFPNTSGRLDPDNYFGNGNIAGKTWVAIYGSSDATGLPTAGYLINSVTDGQTIKITADAGGSASGTAMLYVGTDPNRNQAVFDVWEGFAPAGANTNFTTDADSNILYPADNKGTKPNSLGESVALQSVLAEGGFNSFIDFHCGAGVNYMDFSAATIDLYGSLAMKRECNTLSKSFGETVFNGTEANVVPTYPYTTLVNELKYKLPSFAIEWESPSVLSDADAVRAQRWMSICIINSLKYKN